MRTGSQKKRKAGGHKPENIKRPCTDEPPLGKIEGARADSKTANPLPGLGAAQLDLRSQQTDSAADWGAGPATTESPSKRKVGQEAIETEHYKSLRGKLLEAWEHFQKQQKDRLVCCEVDVATLLIPERALGRQVRVYWPDEDAWFLGSISSYNASTGQHQVLYADGDEESLWLARPVERIRMELQIGERFERPGPAQLSSLARTLALQAEKLCNSKDKQTEDVRRAEALKQSSQRLKHEADEASGSHGAGSSAVNGFVPGNVVWAKAKGWPYWPALVTTAEEALAHNVKSVKGVCVQFFGEATWGCIRPADVLSFLGGVERGMFRPQKKPSFQEAVLETLEYLREGQLPEAMLPENNDTGFSSDNEEDVKAHTEFDQEADIELEWRVSGTLTVHKLGRIEYLHPGFHTDKHVWPLGYCCTCSARGPAFGDTAAAHVCEILAAPDGSGPLFRVSCNGEAAASRVSLQQAWQKLHEESSSSSIDILQLSGLKSGKVVRRILQLPNADRLDRFCCWPQGKKPELPKLTVSERRARIKAEAEMQQLPEGVMALELRVLEGARCDACGADDESEDNVLLQCDGPCRAFIHQECCGVLDRPMGAWTCELCKTGCTNPPACVLCPRRGGKLMRTRCGKWCHAACALWVPEAYMDAVGGTEPLVDISCIPKARRQLLCTLCKQSYGACIQCGGSGSCCTAFHPLCARSAGLLMECIHDEHFLAEDSGPKSAVATINLVASSAAPGPGGDVHKRRKVSEFTAGTAVGDGTRLVCYCRKHRPAVGVKQPAASARRSGEAIVKAQPGDKGLTTSKEDMQVAESSRLAAFNHETRRGQRAPEATAAAAAKRSFVQALAYEVTDLPARTPVERAHPSRCVSSDSGDPRFRAAGELGVRKAPGRAGGQGVKSISERYWQMRATEYKRVAFGKSLIHGWGALSKVSHTKGEMVIEYIGELIRPSMADVRERQLYDTLVGAGTYIFRMNDDFCVDATRAGNLAHMLNHSCQPNCFSRTIEITNRGGQLEEHVVIFANENIEAGQELTYDYRFASNEVLACNCGAPRCCGLVNDSGAADLDYVFIPKAQVQPL